MMDSHLSAVFTVCTVSYTHLEESLKEFDSTYFIEIVKKAAGDSLVPVIALDPFVKAVNQNEISMNRAASVIINTFFTISMKYVESNSLRRCV